MKASLKDIAQTLGLSKTTVSWVLSGQGDRKGISKATQDKVMKCAGELNYEPNLLARSLNTGISGTIGLILPSISDLFYSEIAKEIEFEASKKGYSLMICSSESEIEREERMIRMFRAKQLDGIILATTKRSKVEIERLVSDDYPFVLFDRYYPEMDTNYVIIDNESSSYKLTRRLIDRGFKKIAVITTNPHLRTMNMRREGYAMALWESGLEVSNYLYGEVPYVGYEKNIYTVLDRIFKREPDVDGFFFTTHILALEAFRYFNDRGIDINGKYGLACIHEIPVFDVLAPRMNIAHMPIARIGSETVRILVDEIESRTASGKTSRIKEKITLSCDIEWRDKK